MKTLFRITSLSAFAVSLGAPLLAAAQVPTGINLNTIRPYSTGIVNFINGILVPVLMAVAFIVFLYGVYKYFILGAAEEKSRTEGRQFTLWGVIGFVVILSLWGLVNLVMGTFGLTIGGAPPPPTIWGQSGVSGSNNTANTNNSNGGGGFFPAAGQAGGGSQQQYAQQQYNLCRNYGGLVSDCLNTYRQNGGTGSPVTGTTASGSVCSGQSLGASCTVAGRAGTCDYNEQLVFDCYATPGGGGATGQSATCPNGQNADNDCIPNGAACDYYNANDGAGIWQNGSCVLASGGSGADTGGGTTPTCPEGTTYDGSYDCVPNTATGGGTYPDEP